MQSLSNALIKAIYKGPLEESLWQSFLALMKDDFEAPYVTLLLRPPKDGDKGVVLNAFVAFDELYESYRDEYFQQDPFVNLPLGKAFTLNERVNLTLFKQSDYYKNYFQPTEAEYMLGIDLQDASGSSATLRLVRKRDAKNFTAADKSQLEAIGEHLSLAIELYSSIAHSKSEASSYQEAFDHMAMGCVLLDGKGKCLSINAAAEKLLADYSEISLRGDMLHMGDTAEQKRFKISLDELMTDDSHIGQVATFKLDSYTSMAGIGILLKRLPKSSTPGGGPAIAVYISDPLKPKLDKEKLLEQLFGLTVSEARTALALTNGLSLEEAAESLGVTRNTAKSHLSSAFSKTGVSRQSSLVQLILNSVISVG